MWRTYILIFCIKILLFVSIFLIHSLSLYLNTTNFLGSTNIQIFTLFLSSTSCMWVHSHIRTIHDKTQKMITNSYLYACASITLIFRGIDKISLFYSCEDKQWRWLVFSENEEQQVEKFFFFFVLHFFLLEHHKFTSNIIFNWMYSELM